MEDIRQRRAWTLILFWTTALTGVSIQMRGALLPSFQTTYHVSESQLGLVTPVGAVGFIVALLGVGFATGRIRVKRFMLLGVGCTAVGLVAIGLAPTYLVFLGLVGVRMVATGCFRALDRPLLGHLYPDDRGRIFSLQTMGWAVGATAGPLFVTVVLTRYDWRVSYLLLGVAFLPVLAAIWRLGVPDSIENEQSLSLSDLRTLVGRPPVYSMGLLLVVFGSLESVFFTWLPFYATGFFPRSIANLTLSMYLVAYLPGRYAFSHLTGRHSYTALVVGIGGALVVVLFAAFFLVEGYPFLVLVFVSGFLVSGLFPTLLTLGVEATPAFTGPVNALAITFAQTGFFVAPVVVGVLADAYSIQRAMGLQVLFAATLTVLGVALGRGPLRESRSNVR